MIAAERLVYSNAEPWTYGNSSNVRCLGATAITIGHDSGKSIFEITPTIVAAGDEVPVVLMTYDNLTLSALQSPQKADAPLIVTSEGARDVHMLIISSTSQGQRFKTTCPTVTVHP
jgi:hypothetical protein